MDEVSREDFDRITKMSISELSENDKLFLRARRDYLDEVQLKKYEKILNEQPKNIEPEFTYQELLNKAKELGYTGKRLKRTQLETFIKERVNNPFIR